MIQLTFYCEIEIVMPRGLLVRDEDSYRGKVFRFSRRFRGEDQNSFHFFSFASMYSISVFTFL